MKALSFLSRSAILMMAAAACLFAQEKGKLPELAANATIEETQAWLTKHIPKSSPFTVKNAKNEIVEPKFQGCRLSYRIIQESRYEPSTVPQQSTMDRGTSGSMSEVVARTVLVISLNFAEIDPASIKSVQLETNNKMQTITASTFSGATSIVYNYDPGTRFNKSRNVSTAYMHVKEPAAEQIKAALTHAANLCQAK